MAYYVKLTVLTIKTIPRSLTLFVLLISAFLCDISLLCGHAKERPSASEEVVARPRNILARPRSIFARPRTFLARPSPILVNPSYFSSFERRLLVNETFWTSSMPFLTRPRQIQDHLGRLRAERIRAFFFERPRTH